MRLTCLACEFRSGYEEEGRGRGGGRGGERERLMAPLDTITPTYLRDQASILEMMNPAVYQTRVATDACRLEHNQPVAFLEKQQAVGALEGDGKGRGKHEERQGISKQGKEGEG